MPPLKNNNKDQMKRLKAECLMGGSGSPESFPSHHNDGTDSRSNTPRRPLRHFIASLAFGTCPTELVTHVMGIMFDVCLQGWILRSTSCTQLPLSQCNLIVLSDYKQNTTIPRWLWKSSSQLRKKPVEFQAG